MATLQQEAQTKGAATNASVAKLAHKLEVLVLPVADAERAKDFYAGLGWRLDADYDNGSDFRVIQFTPTGSGCSIIFGKNVTAAAPGSAQGLYLVVSDVAAARDELLGRGVKVSEVFHDAGGVFLGIPTAFVLLSNGWMLGTVAAAVRLGGYDFQFWSLIVPHGVLELSVIVISGGTGLMLGDAILRPGELRRGEALARVARRAVMLVLGAASLLVVAGTLGAFVSPSGLPDGAKLAIGAIVGVLLYSWLLLAGRNPHRRRSFAFDRPAETPA